MAGSSGIKSSAERQGGDRTSRLSWIVGLDTDVAAPVDPRPSGGSWGPELKDAHAPHPHGQEQPGGAVVRAETQNKPYGPRVRPAAPSPPQHLQRSRRVKRRTHAF